jgi:hypothetical protein
MRLRFIGIVFSILAFNFSFSQDSPEDIITTFFEKFKDSSSTIALDYLYGKNQWVNKVSDDIMNVKKQVGSLTEDYVGKYYGYEEILEKKLSDSFILKSYLVKYGRQPFRFTFQFYKPDKEWMVFSFGFDASLDDEIEESAKLYRYRLN